MRYVSVELLRAWGRARVGTITQPAGGPGPGPGPGPPPARVRPFVCPRELLPARHRDTLARYIPSFLFLALSRTADFNRAALRANRKISRHCDRLPRIYDPRLVISIHEV